MTIIVATLPQPLFLLSSIVALLPPFEDSIFPRYLIFSASGILLEWTFSSGQTVFIASEKEIEKDMLEKVPNKGQTKVCGLIEQKVRGTKAEESSLSCPHPALCFPAIPCLCPVLSCPTLAKSTNDQLGSACLTLLLAQIYLSVETRWMYLLN